MTIPDIILRLARRYLPVDARTPEPPPTHVPHELPELPAVPLAPVRLASIDDLAESSSAPEVDQLASATERSALEFAVPSPTAQSFPADSQGPASAPTAARQPAGMAEPEMQPAQDDLAAAEESDLRSQFTTRLPCRASGTRGKESTLSPPSGESFVDAEPAFGQPDFAQPGFAPPDSAGPGNFEPSFASRSIRPSAINNQSDDPFAPLARPAADTGRARNQSPVDAVNESSRQLEESTRDLESSLTRLFTTQIESLQRLRDRIDEHERRWVEQQSARRAML